MPTTTLAQSKRRLAIAQVRVDRLLGTLSLARSVLAEAEAEHRLILNAQKEDQAIKEKAAQEKAEAKAQDRERRAKLKAIRVQQALLRAEASKAEQALRRKRAKDNIAQAAPTKKGASAKKPAPVKKATPAKKEASAKKPAPVKKATPAKKGASAKKPAPVKKATPAKKGASAKKPGKINPS